MSRPRLDVLVLAAAESELSLAAALRRRRHSVRCARSAAEALALPACDVLVADLDLPAETAFELLEQLQARKARTRALLFAREPAPRDYRRALQLGAADLLARPFLLEELVRAVEACAPPPEPPRPAAAALPIPRGLTCELPARPDSLDAFVRELCAFLVRQGLPPSVRARACGACHELLENAAQHAFAPGQEGRVRVEARIEAGVLRLDVRDEGQGFDLGRGARTLSGGLARASTLADELSLESRPGQGTHARLAFSTWGADLSSGDLVDLSEHDHLAPGLARRVLASLAVEPPEPAFHLSPALAVVVGRLLAGVSERQAAERALWRASA